MKTTLLLLALPTTIKAASTLPVFGDNISSSVLPSSSTVGPVTITVHSNGEEDQSFLFRTYDYLPQDPDLYLPHKKWTALAISEDGSMDDEAKGGSITLTFDEPITTFSYRFIDIEEGAYISINPSRPISFPILYTRDNRYTSQQVLDFSTPQDSVTITFQGSGAIANMEYVCDSSIPEPSTSALTLMSILLLISRKKRCHTQNM